MTIISKIFNPKNILFGLLLLYFTTRLFNLTILPIFMDESIYIYWAKIISTTHRQFFISLYDGKPPLFIWLVSATLTLFRSDWYLFAGRLVSVFAGAISMLGIYNLSKTFFKEKTIPIISSLVYISLPFNLAYDRLALMDSLLTAMLVWSTYFTIKTAKTLSLRYAILWGLFLGLAFLAKPTALLFVILTPICFIISLGKLRNFNWKETALLVGTAIALGELINNLQRVSGSYAQMVVKNQQFQEPLRELLKNPMLLLGTNSLQFSNWMISYFTLPLFIFGCIAFAILLLKNLKVGSILIALWLLPTLILAIVGREVYPRYLLIVTPYMIVAISYLTYMLITLILKQKNLLIQSFSFTVIVSMFIPILHFDYYLLANPTLAPFPKADLNQLVSEHPSGYGLDKIFTYLDKEVKKRKINLVIEGTFGLYPYAFQLHYWNNKNVSIITRWPLDNLDSELANLKKFNNTFFVLNEHEYNPGQLSLKELVKAEKPGSKKYPIFLTTFP